MSGAGTTGTFDVVISGGGMVGASLAWALSGLSLRVALVEAVPIASAAQPSFDERTLALSRGSHQILSSLGLWEGLAASAAPIRAIHVSERGRFGTALITAEGQGVADLGFVVPARALGAVLWDRLGTSGVAVHCPARVTGVARASGHIEVQVTAGDGPPRVLAARLLVVAEGAGSALRGDLGIGARRRAYDQTAIVANLEATGPAPVATAWERFTDEGPAALLPLGPTTGGNRFVAVLARRPGAAAALAAAPEEAFLAELQRIFGGRAGRFVRVGRRSAYELALTRADALTAPRAVLVGNAAHGLHPVAGQGYNLGLRDVAALAECVADAVRATPGCDVGDPALLARYAAWRTRDQRSVVAFTDGLIRLFELPSRVVPRGLGLVLFDLVPGAKRALAHRTMGLAGRTSRLARGLPL